MNNLESSQSTLSPTLVEAVFAALGQTGRPRLIRIAGCSMLPLIQDGDQVLVAPGRADIRPGDVLIFQQNERLVAHRLLRVERENADGELRFITKGDNVAYLDPAIPASQIMGRVLAVKRGQRELRLDTPSRRRLGRLIALGMLGWTTLLGWLWRFRPVLKRTMPNYIITVLKWGMRAPSVVLKVLHIAHQSSN